MSVAMIGASLGYTIRDTICYDNPHDVSTRFGYCLVRYAGEIVYVHQTDGLTLYVHKPWDKSYKSRPVEMIDPYLDVAQPEIGYFMTRDGYCIRAVRSPEKIWQYGLNNSNIRWERFDRQTAGHNNDGSDHIRSAEFIAAIEGNYPDKSFLKQNVSELCVSSRIAFRRHVGGEYETFIDTELVGLCDGDVVKGKFTGKTGKIFSDLLAPHGLIYKEV